MKRKLCPRVDESMSYLGLKIHDSLFSEIETLRRVHVQTRSEVVRCLIIEALRARGRVATVAEMTAESAA